MLVIVKDTGIGIEENHVRKMFYKLIKPWDFNKNISGTRVGLGLMISNLFVELLGPKSRLKSTICVDSVEGKGSCFSFGIRDQSFDTPENIIVSEKSHRFSPNKPIPSFIH